jgi:hypothetical protein
MNEHEKESVVKAQITYFKWVMSPPNIDHKLFFFSKERKKLSCETLIQNLLKIVYKLQKHFIFFFNLYN